jgi:hypothetical protein
MKMAKLYWTNSASHPHCYALQQWEDIMIAGAYLDLQTAAVPTQRHAILLAVLETYWMTGQGLSDRTLISLNNIRRRENLSQITFVDGHSSTYSLARGETKANQRTSIMERMRQLKLHNPMQYAQILGRARAVAMSLPARDPLQFVA